MSWVTDLEGYGSSALSAARGGIVTVYDATLGRVGAEITTQGAKLHAFEDSVGQTVVRTSNAPADVIDAAKNAAVDVEQKASSAIAGLATEAGAALRDVSGAVGNVGKGAGSALDKTGSGLKWAGFGLGLLVVVLIVGALIFVFKNPKATAAAVAA